MIKIIQIAIRFYATLNVTRGFAVFFLAGGGRNLTTGFFLHVFKMCNTRNARSALYRWCDVNIAI